MECSFGSQTFAFREGKKFIINTDDYEKYVKGYSFKLSVAGYVQYSSSKDGLHNKYLHRVILGQPNGKDVDHINRNPLDNRRENLRICTHQQNQFNKTKRSDNTSGYKGVYFHKQKQKFRAQIMVDKKPKHLGYFDTAERAHEEYQKAALKLHGNFARF